MDGHARTESEELHTSEEKNSSFIWKIFLYLLPRKINGKGQPWIVFLHTREYHSALNVNTSKCTTLEENRF